MTMKLPVTKFKARCTKLLRELPQRGEPIEVTSRGKLVAVVSPPPPRGRRNPAWGALQGSVAFMAPDFDEPLGDTDWEAGR